MRDDVSGLLSSCALQAEIEGCSWHGRNQDVNVCVTTRNKSTKAGGREVETFTDSQDAGNHLQGPGLTWELAQLASS